MQFRILGPLEVTEQDRALDLGGAKQRSPRGVPSAEAADKLREALAPWRKRLERAILEQDPALDLEARPPRRQGPTPERSLLVVGLSDRWREEGLGRARSELAGAPPAPTVLVRRGPRPGGLGPDGTCTRFGWSLTGRGV